MNRLTEWVIDEAFRCLERGEVDAFFEYVHDDVKWTVMGSHLISGTYDSKASFREGPFVPITRDLRNGAEVRVRHRMVEGNCAVVELETVPTDYKNKSLTHCYCWVIEVNEGLITRVRAYVDAGLIQEMIVN